MTGEAQLIWYNDDKTLWTRGGVYLMTGTIDECANEFPDIVIWWVEN